jgi:hypothetical protein
VKRHVAAMREMIGAAKEKELAEKRLEDYYKTQSQHNLSLVSECKAAQEGVTLKRKMKKMAFDSQSSSSPPTLPTTPVSSTQPQVDESKERNGLPSSDDPIPLPNDAATAQPVVHPVTTTDFTRYPSLLDSRFEALDKQSSVRPTIINPGKTWTKRSQKALLAEPASAVWGEAEQLAEKNAAFELLDALSRSGGLSFDCASLHVVMAATHCFDASLMDTVVKGNVNPIERVERTMLIMASTVHGVAATELLEPAQCARVEKYSPQLFNSV